MKNYYEMLEVNPKASKEIIEKAYRVLVKKYHPDLYQGDEKLIAQKKVQELNEAYHVLSDNFLREQYDIELEREKENRYNNVSYENSRRKNNVRQENNVAENNETQGKQHQVGTFMSLVDLSKSIFKNRTKRTEKRKLQKEDKMAAAITFVIVVILGIILWFIPATNGFIRDLIPF